MLGLSYRILYIFHNKCRYYISRSLVSISAKIIWFAAYSPSQGDDQRCPQFLKPAYFVIRIQRQIVEPMYQNLRARTDITCMCMKERNQSSDCWPTRETDSERENEFIVISFASIIFGQGQSYAGLLCKSLHTAVRKSTYIRRL